MRLGLRLQPRHRTLQPKSISCSCVRCVDRREPSGAVLSRLRPIPQPSCGREPEALHAAGFDPGVIDGEFGPHTSSAVVAFQLSLGMLADGEVGPNTARALSVQL